MMKRLPETEPAPHVGQLLQVDSFHAERKVESRRGYHRADGTVDPWSYLAKLGLGTIRLAPVEFRILQFLAARPYHAFSRRRIAEAASTADQPVTEATLGRYIRSLRDQLGFYSDYIQRVPYIGYRFKA
jgi:DNA-binding response OmpR family regulator